MAEHPLFDDTPSAEQESAPASVSVPGCDSVELDLIARSGCDSVDAPMPEIAPASVPLETLAANYDRLDRISQSEECDVFKGYDRRFQRHVIIKSLREEFAHDLNARRRFLIEAQLMARLDNPAVSPVFDLRTDGDGGLHLIMKYLSGKTLRTYLAKLGSLYELTPRPLIAPAERRSQPRRLELFLHLCDALAYVHNCGVVHRDLHTANIILGKYNEIYILDWGCAGKVYGDCQDAPTGSHALTPPELAKNATYDRSSEIYVLGSILFELVYLRVPEPGRFNYTHRFGCPVAADLTAVIRKALDANPTRRYRNVYELSADLRNAMIDEEVTAKPDNLLRRIRRKVYRHRTALALIAVVLTLLLTAGGAFYGYRDAVQREQALARENMLGQVYASGLRSAMLFNQRILGFENALRNVAHNAAMLLEKPDAPAAAERVYLYTDARSPQTAPPQYQYVKAYSQPISLEAFVCKPPVDGNPADDAAAMNRLAPLKRCFWGAVASSIDDNSYQPLHDSELKSRILEGVRPPLSFIYIALAQSGLHLSYPYHADYSADYDPRVRPWYRAAAKLNPGEEVWGNPYIDTGEVRSLVVTCSTPIYSHQDKFLGCAGADVTLDSLFALLTAGQNGPSYILDRYLVNAQGQIVAESVMVSRREPVLRPFPQPALFEEMKAKQIGLSFQDGTVWSYFFIPALKWYYVEEISYDGLCAAAHAAEEIR